jgi:hypothetical protein
MDLRKQLRWALMSSLLFASTAAAQAGIQASDDEKPPADEPAAKGEIPPQEAGDTSAILAGKGSTKAEPEAAEPKETKPPISIGIAIGWGTDFVSDAPNIFGLGFGLNGGYTFDFGLFIGGQFEYFLGSTNPGIAPDTEVSSNEMLLGVDVGYNINVKPVTIRPSLALGMTLRHTFNENGLNADTSSNNVNFYAAPGALVTFPIKNFFVGGDLRFLEITEEISVEAIRVMAVGGLNFGKRRTN